MTTRDSTIQTLKSLGAKRSEELQPAFSARKILPLTRHGYSLSMKFDEFDLELTTSNFADGTLGEVRVDMPDFPMLFRTSVLAFAQSLTLGLQYGMSLENYVRQFQVTRTDMVYEVVGHDWIFRASSVPDLIVRDLAISYLGREDLIQEAWAK